MLFNSDYPFSPPEIKTSKQISVNLNILSQNNWSPVLSYENNQ